MIYGIVVTDPEVFAATCLLLMFTALLATYFPARRATKWILKAHCETNDNWFSVPRFSCRPEMI
jgi:hypothetical protein